MKKVFQSHERTRVKFASENNYLTLVKDVIFLDFFLKWVCDTQ